MIHILLEMRIVFAKRCCWGAPREALKHSTSSSTVMEPRKPAYRVFSGGDPCLPLQLAVWPGEGPASLDLLGPSVKGRSHWLAGNQMDKLTAVGSCERGSHVVHCSVVSDSLRLYGLQHSRHPCPSRSPEVCSKSCPLSQ